MGISLDISIQLMSADDAISYHPMRCGTTGTYFSLGTCERPNRTRKRNDLAKSAQSRSPSIQQHTHVSRILLQPTVRAEVFNVFTVHLFVTMNHPRIGAYDSLLGYQYGVMNDSGEHTPAGMKVFAMVAPPAGVTRGKLMPTAG